MQEKYIMKKITVIFALFCVCLVSGCDWDAMSEEPDQYEENDSFAQAPILRKVRT